MLSTILKNHSYINGDWTDAATGKRFSVINPATGEQLAELPDCHEQEFDHAINSAHSAFPDWAGRTAKERADVLKRWYALVQENKQAIAELMTRESGKTLDDSLAEVAYGSGFIEWFAEEARRVYGDVIPAHRASTKIIVTREPVGVCAVITPWNFPLAMITRKCAAALAAGCTVVVKPTAATPLTALALAELGERAGIPSGVFNVVTTTDSKLAGKMLTEDARIRKVTFTGSTGVGKVLMQQSASTVKNISLELGGNAPFIVFEDADLEAAVAGAMASKYRNSGQTCICANRFLVHSSVVERFAARLAEETAKLRVGNGLEEGVRQGPLIDEHAVAKVDELVQDAIDKGATLLTGGARSSAGPCFYQPTVLKDVRPDMHVISEEIFGPVAPIMQFDTEAEAIELANDTPFGLAAYFYSRDVGRVWRVAQGLEYGMIGINEGAISTEVAPFGGVKESGIGREGSKYGIEEYTEMKYLCMGGLA